MGGNVNWKPLAAVGAILVGFTFTDLSPKGPWNDATFTSGSIGLIGLTMLYMAWFRFTFNREGLVPTMDLWKNPEKTSLRVIATGIVMMIGAYIIGRVDFFPEPAGLIVTLIGTLTLTNGVYVWMSVTGPLSETSDESE